MKVLCAFEVDQSRRTALPESIEPPTGTATERFWNAREQRSSLGRSRSRANYNNYNYNCGSRAEQSGARTPQRFTERRAERAAVRYWLRAMESVDQEGLTAP